MKPPRHTPYKRVNPSGQIRWKARWKKPDGTWASAGTFALKRDAQNAIDDAVERAYRRPWQHRGRTVGDYAATWTARHPRADRTNRTNDHRLSRVLPVVIDGRPLRDWPLEDLRRRHALELVDHLLRRQGRTHTGAQNLLRTLSAMHEDAITDELAELNPWKGVRVRATDPRITKRNRPVRVWSWADMHRFAAAAGSHEAMVRCLSDLGLRLGELLPLERGDLERTDQGAVLLVRRTADEGRVVDGTKTDHGDQAGGRVAPVPPGVLALLEAQPPRLDTRLLFPTPTGRLFRQRNFYRDVWQPARDRTGLDIRPHEMRHSYVSHLRAAGIDDADLADVAGHRVETMLARYTHGLGRSFDQIRRVIG